MYRQEGWLEPAACRFYAGCACAALHHLHGLEVNLPRARTRGPCYRPLPRHDYPAYTPLRSSPAISSRRTLLHPLTVPLPPLRSSTAISSRRICCSTAEVT